MKQPKLMLSGKFELNKLDWQKWGKNTLIFLAPAALLFLMDIRAGRSVNEALLSLKLWALNCILDLIKKFIKDNTK